MTSLAEEPLQDRLTRIFDDAGGSDTLVDLLAEFDFESSRELAEAITIGIAMNRSERAEAEAAEPRKLFPILGGEGAKVDWQFVQDHGKQAYDNHRQTVQRLAERGGLAWSELCAVIQDRKWHSMGTTDAIEQVRAAEARYLAAINPAAEARAEVEREIVAWLRTYPPVIGLSQMAAWNTAAHIERGDHRSSTS